MGDFSSNTTGRASGLPRSLQQPDARATGSTRIRSDHKILRLGEHRLLPRSDRLAQSRSRHSSCLPWEHGSAHLGTVHEPPASGRLTRADMWRAPRARDARTDSPFSDRRRLTADWLRLHVRPARGAARRIGHAFRVPLSGHSITGVFSSRRSVAHAVELGRLARRCRSARSARDCYERRLAGGRRRSRARARSRTLRRLRCWHSSPTSTGRPLALYRVQGTPRAR